MGCDIHLHVEALVPSEDVVLKDGDLAVITTGAADWQRAEGKHANPYYDPTATTDESDDDYDWSEIDEFEHDSWYGGRNYQLFGILAGVRHSGRPDQIDEPRGLPEDVSPDLFEDHRRWDVDAHSASWLTLTELEAYDKRHGFDKNHSGEFLDTVKLMREHADTFLGGDGNKIRIVFWFDN